MSTSTPRGLVSRDRKSVVEGKRVLFRSVSGRHVTRERLVPARVDDDNADGSGRHVACRRRHHEDWSAEIGRASWRASVCSSDLCQVVMSHGSDSFRPESTTTTPMGAVDTSHVDVDTTRTGQQYVASAGLNRGELHVAGFARLRLRDSLTLFTPSLSIREAFGPLAVRADIEGKSVDSLSRVSVAAEAPLLRSFHIGGAVDRASDHL